MASAHNDGSDGVKGKLLVTAIEEKARLMPHHTYMMYPPVDWQMYGYRTLTWSQFAKAIDKMAYWLDKQLGQAKGIETIAYSGPSDPRHVILIPACIKSGRRLLLPDGRLTKEGLSGLLRATNCKTWLQVKDHAHQLSPTEVSCVHTIVHSVPSMDYLMDNAEQSRYPYDKTFEQAAKDEIVVIHTSGTTGTPRPIRHTNAMYSVVQNYNEASRKYWPRGITYDSWTGKLALNVCPVQWSAGVHNALLGPVFLDSPCVLLPPDVVGLSPGMFKDIFHVTHLQGIKCPPHTIKILYAHPETKALVRSLDFVMYVGAPLERTVGDDLCQYTRLTPMIGSTEFGDQPSLRPMDRRLWYTHDYLPDNGHKMVPINDAGDSSDELHELVIERLPSGRMSAFQAAFWNPDYEHVQRIEMKELYSPVKDADGRTRWVFVTRKDDFTKLNWLAKFHAQDLEAKILRHPDVKNVIVGGEGRPTPYVIIEPKEGVLANKSEEQLCSDLYRDAVAGTNSTSIDEIRIPKETVLIAQADKPFKLNLKQVVLRREVEKEYAEEIEQAYLQLSEGGKARL